MERFFSKKRKGESSSASIASIRGANVEVDANVEVETNFEEYVRDPGLRRPIEEFDIAIRDQIRREYLSMGPCQLVGHNYPKTQFGNQLRSFQDVWYQKFVWLEYSVAKYACFCFWCYLFKPEDKSSRYRTDVFTKTGFTNWKKALIKFVEHVGDADSCHNNARIQVEAFKDQRHSVANMFRSNARELDVAYRTRLTASLDVTRFLLKQGLPFRGHDESTTSLNREICDVFVGDWVGFEGEPLYNKSCSFISRGNQLNCLENGRPDPHYLHWRWKPRACELPRFDPLKFLEMMRNKSWAFIGDSISRNHIQSLLCMLSTANVPYLRPDTIDQTEVVISTYYRDSAFPELVAISTY